MPLRRATRSGLPASLILTPHELKHYCRWQRKTPTFGTESLGNIPNATQYADFQAWLAKRDSGYFSDTTLAGIACHLRPQTDIHIAESCRHALHPAYNESGNGKSEVVQRCPVCIVECHFTYMKLLTRLLISAGGLVPQRWEPPPRDNKPVEAWYAGKLDFLQEISRLEAIAQEEEKWEQQHPEQSPSTNDIKSAAQALDIYWKSVEHSSCVTPGGTLKMGKEARKVQFDEGTDFTKGRDPLYFCRRSPRYEVGKYSSFSEEDDEYEVSDAESEDSDVGNNADKKKLLVGQPEPAEAEDDEESEWDDFDSDDDELDDAEGDEEGAYVFLEAEVREATSFIVFED